jgi:hypothetical protein
MPCKYRADLKTFQLSGSLYCEIEVKEVVIDNIII